MTCGDSGNPVLDLVKGFFSFLGDPVGTIVGLIAKTILAGAVETFGALTYEVPTLAGTGSAKNVNGQTQWLVVYLAVGSLLFATARMAVERRGTAGTTALKGMVRVIVVSGAATTVVTAAASVADDYSKYLFDAGAKDLLTKVGACSDGSGIDNFLLLFLAFLLLIAGVIQTILMYIRLGVMVVLLGTLPLAAAASMTDWGGSWWRKHIGWMIAWLLYKPAAGLVLYAGSEMITSSQTVDLGKQGNHLVSERIAGIGVMLLSAVALPALLKLVVPATAALGGGSAYSGAMQAVGGALATGARSLGGAGGGSGGQGRPGPSGASGAAGGSGGSGSSGADGPGGAPGSGGGTGPAGTGGSGTSGGAGTSGGSGRAAAAAGGPAGAAVAAAVTTAQIIGRAASGALDGTDGP